MATIQELENRISELERWKEQKLKQQINFPIDNESLVILGKYFLRKLGNLDFTNSSGTELRNIIVQQDDRVDVLPAKTILYKFTVNTTDDEINIGQDIINLNQGSFQNDDQVYLLSTGTLPSPLVEAVPYYVVNSSNGGKTIKLSLTSGGSAINITNVGSGDKYIEPY